MQTVTLYRPVGTKELQLIEQNNFTAFPPRLPEQLIFYPVTNEAYAAQIARDWNAKFNEDKSVTLQDLRSTNHFSTDTKRKSSAAANTRNNGFRRKI